MPQNLGPQQDFSLGQWLDWIQLQHPVEIDMGLHRVGQVAARLGLIGAAAKAPVAPLVITVGGTNGKGSCVAMLESILRTAGYRTGTYTSPHILRYNERIGLAGEPVSDALLCEAFWQICESQGDIPLSYFEYGTLAGLLILQQASVDVAILEVGLGGRLDAVNIVDADITVISSIDLDHQEWLGDTRELIGREKAGIFRAGRPAVCGEPDLPQSVRAHAQTLGTPIYQLGVDYAVIDAGTPWKWRGKTANGAPMELAGLPHPGLDLVNAATVLQVLHLLSQPPGDEAVREGLARTCLPGRFQQLHDCRSARRGDSTGDPGGSPVVIVDVAHNPHAGRMLASKLLELKRARGGKTRIHLLLAMMHDKDHRGFFAALENAVDIWYIAHFPQPRCLEAAELFERLATDAIADMRGPYPDLEQAYEQARRNCESGDVIVATGSFFTVAGIMQLIDKPTPVSASERQD